ncbi:TonB-dependent receptor [Glaciecola petra]|uniref:TonB-dependent receptor n=1 Tax=Glaciecola petra TaxID=3075602 RepID=A0ABU2ZUZ0_9ALTE|nr:TonB-dependent receptor [Aestuariibacter sp. P117]MDT0596460.1 TonB-dependent receptor [Aestuariibacter sp. P117]
MNKTLFSSAISLVLAGYSDVSLAQEQTNKENRALEVIEVKAQKRTQNLQDVPVAVSAVNGETLVEEAISDIHDLKASVPGLNVYNTLASTQPSISIRGVGTASTNFGLESSVGLYQDGVYRARQNAMINDYVDVDTVEVLRGPQGTLFGKNTPMGAINVRTVAPRHDGADGFFEATVGNYGLLSFSGAGNFNAIEDVLSFRLTHFMTDRDGTIDDVNFGEDVVNDRNRYGTRLQALYTPSDDVSLRVIADYNKIEEICCGGNVIVNNFQNFAGRPGTDAAIPVILGSPVSLAENYQDRVTNTTFLPVSNLEDKGISAELNWEINPDLTFTSITSYRDSLSFDKIDGDYLQADIIGSSKTGDQKAFTQELRFTYTTDDFNFVGGAYYFTQELVSVGEIPVGEEFNNYALNVLLGGSLNQVLGGINGLSQATGGLIAPAAQAGPGGTRFFANATQDQDSIALFGQFDYKLSDTVTLTAGLRYTDESKDLVNVFTEEYASGIDHPTFFTSIGDPTNPQTIVPGSILFGAAVAGQTIQQIQSGMIQPGTPQFAQAVQNLVPFQTPGWIFNVMSAQTADRPDEMATLEDSNVSGTVKLSYQPDSDTLWYASYSTGHKSGGTNADRIAVTFDTVFDAESSKAYEVGLKKDFPDYGLRLNLAAHKTEVEDFQANSYVGEGFNLQNAGTYDIEGLEAEVRWMLTDTTLLTFNYAYTDAEYGEFEQGPCWIVTPFQTGQPDPGQQSTDPLNPNSFCDRQGGKPLAQPDSTAMLQLSEEFTVSDDIYATASIDYSYIGEHFGASDNDPLSLVDSQGFVNARVRFNFEDYDLSVLLWGRNITNEESVGVSAPASLQAGKLVAYYIEPATFGLTVVKKFD